jgi:hypothetical protein
MNEVKTKVQEAQADVIECKRCLFTSDIAKIHDDGECEYCKLQDGLRNQEREPFEDVLNAMRRKGEGKQYDCLIGISGGEDSSVLLYLAVKSWGLRPLVIHFNNRTNRPEADHNIRLLTESLGVNFIEYFLDQREYELMCDAFLMAGLPDADIVNDIAMAKLMYVTARQYGIKYILNGHDFRNEGSSPKAWSLIDSTYIKSVYKRVFKKDAKNYPFYTVWDQIVSGFLGIKQIRPYHYSDHNRPAILRKLKQIGWRDYGGKHNENIYTAFVGNYLLPRKFKIDKRRTYLSAQIRECIITKQFAKEVLTEHPFPVFDLNDLGNRKDRVVTLMNSSPVMPRSLYKTTNFKKLKPLFWLLVKLNIVPKTMYVKYCK